MLRLLMTTLTVVAFVSLSQAQILTLRGGYQAAFRSFKGMNDVTNSYDETRSYLTDELGNFGYTQGYTLELGIALAGEDGGIMAGVQLGFTNQRDKLDAEGNVGGQDFRRELRYRTNMVTIGGSIGVHAERKLGLELGMRAAIGSVVIDTQIDPAPGSGATDWEEVYRDGLEAYLTPFLRVSTYPGISLELYVDIDVVSDVLAVQETDEAINPATATFNLDRQGMRTGGFGFRVLAGL